MLIGITSERMSRIIKFDDKIEEYLQQQIKRLKDLGINPVTRPMALGYIIEQNKKVMVELRRKNKRKNDIIIKLK